MKVILRLVIQSRELARVWISNLHSVKLRVEAMQVELSMITNTYSATESDFEPMLVMLVTHSPPLLPPASPAPVRTPPRTCSC